MSELVAKFLDVGQGDSTLVILPEGDGVLIDCPAREDRSVVDQLEEAQITNLKLMVVTHSDQDHAGGCIDVVKHFAGRIGKLALLPDRVSVERRRSGSKYRHLLQELAQLQRQGRFELWFPFEDECIKFSDVKIFILHPSKADLMEALSHNNPNDSSIVLRIDYAGARILLSADVQQMGWKWMVDRDTDLKADVFKFPHHGAWYEGEPSLSEIMDRVDPSVVVISVGTANNYEHPSPDTLRLLRSRQCSIRFMCTAATPRCHGKPEVMASQVRELLPLESQGGHSYHNPRSCPCAGHVTIRISSTGVEVSPTLEQHGRVIDLFETPQCRGEST